ncbi:MAG TPA: hypothetical protein VG167_03560 [Verrucomicrobiae bacterium]|nr:hypothetical protein [Verrucomicrobiae bacterium]
MSIFHLSFGTGCRVEIRPSRLRLAHYLEPNWEDWRNAAALGRELAAKGHDVRLTDLVVAALAQRVGASVYTNDPHFDLIRPLQRYQPPGS